MVTDRSRQTVASPESPLQIDEYCIAWPSSRAATSRSFPISGPKVDFPENEGTGIPHSRSME
jgi:hypothetical protein